MVKRGIEKMTKKVYWKTWKKTAVFIDVSNIYYSQRTLSWEIDYLKLIKFFKEKTNLTKAYFYSGVVSTKKSQQKFFTKMGTFGYIVKTKEVKWIKNKEGKIIKGKGNLDIELALDMVLSLKTYDTAILLSGDSDFEPVIKYLRSKKRKVIVISSRGHISRELARGADKYIPFESLKQFLKRSKKIINKKITPDERGDV